MKNSIRFLLTISILIIGAAAINGQIINIPADYNTIQEGINAAQNGDIMKGRVSHIVYQGVHCSL